MKAREIIRKLFAEFDQVPDDVIDTWIMLERPSVSRKKFGDQYEYALALLCCHRMKMQGLGSASGVAGSSLSLADVQGLSSVSEGETSISFASSGGNPSEGDLEKTSYGQRFLSLKIQRVVPITIRRGGDYL